MFDDIEVTKREILFSITIICVMVGLGILISNHIMSDWYEKEMAIFSAVRVDKDKEKFDYVMRTDAGDFLAYGTLDCIRPVSLPELKGKYLKIRKVKETYESHTRTYTTTDGNGHTQTHTEIYWSWDYAGEEEFVVDSVTFLGKIFAFDRIDMDKWPEDFDTTIKDGGFVRYIYHAYPRRTNGIMTGKAKNKAFCELSFISGTDIPKYLEDIENKGKVINACFWIAWIILTGLIVFLFYAGENNWLED